MRLRPCLSLLVALLPCTRLAAAEVAERIFSGGTILTFDAQDRAVEAVAVAGGKVLRTGSLHDMDGLRGPTTESVDLRGATLLPGFYAAHDHFPQAGNLALFNVDLNSPPIGTIRTIDELVAALRAHAAKKPKGTWIVGRGYDDTLLREGRHPTHTDLDRASTDHPIWIVHTSGHFGVANSRALAIAKVTRDSAQPGAGRVQLDPATGEPNGVMEETATALVSRFVRALTPDERQQAMAWCDRHYLSRGVTTTVIAGGGTGAIREIDTAVMAGRLHVRVVAMISGSREVSGTPASVAALSRNPEQVHAGAIKLLQDGSLQGYTGYLRDPYYQQPEGKTDYRGYARRAYAALVAQVKQYHNAGFQIAIHANGDAAIDEVLNAYAEAQKENPRPDARHRIEHCQTPREDQLERMRTLGVTPSFFNGHVYYWGDRHRDIFLGPDRGARISPLASALKHGLRFTLHNDTPVTPVDPLLLVWSAVTRQTTGGNVLGPEQRIPVLQALRAVTRDAAWQNFEETTKGMIEAGKLADFVVLAENPLTIAPEKLKDLPVLATIVGGKTVFARDKPATSGR